MDGILYAAVKYSVEQAQRESTPYHGGGPTPENSKEYAAFRRLCTFDKLLMQDPYNPIGTAIRDAYHAG